MLRKLKKLILFILFVAILYKLSQAKYALSKEGDGWSLEIDFKGK